MKPDMEERYMYITVETSRYISLKKLSLVENRSPVIKDSRFFKQTNNSQKQNNKFVLNTNIVVITVVLLVFKKEI